MKNINEQGTVPAAVAPASTSADVATFPTPLGIKKKKKKKKKGPELEESVLNMVGTFYIYKIIKQLILPYNKWEAFKDGAIDKDGKIIDKTVDMSFYDKVLLSIKKILSKFMNKKTLSLMLILKYITENVQDRVQDKEYIPFLLEMIENRYFKDVKDDIITEADIESNYKLVINDLFI